MNKPTDRAKTHVMRAITELGEQRLSISAIAGEALYSERYVRAVLDALDREGFIVRTGGGRGKAYHYRVVAE